MPTRLITIPFSHYCEKARWALDRAGIAYVEEPHLPMFAWVPALRAGQKRTVPVLVTDDGVLTDSHDILAWAHRKNPDAGLYPDDVRRDVEDVEALFDRKVGPAARRLAYHAAMTEPSVTRDLFSVEGPRWEIATARVALPLMMRMMKFGLKIDDAGALRSRTQLDPVLADVEARVAKSGGPWLFGDRFTAADLTFAALMTPLVAPPSVERRFGAMRGVCPPLQALVDTYRATKAGELALRAYEEQRA